MKNYDIVIKNVYTSERRSISVPANTSNIQLVHKEALKSVRFEEDIVSIKLENRLMYTLDRGFIS